MARDDTVTLSAVHALSVKLEAQREERRQIYHNLVTSRAALDETSRLQLEILSREFYPQPGALIK